MLLTLEQKAQRARELNNVRVRRYRERHPDKVLAGVDRNDARKPKAVRARNIIRNEIVRGRIARQPCEVCGKAYTHAHHDDYDKPRAVRWLCPVHHREWHDANGPGANLEGEP